jgi:WD40 repeat protein
MLICVKVWSLEDGTIQKTFIGHEDNIFSMEYNQRGNFIVSGSEDHTLRVWHLEHTSLNRKFAINDRVLTISVATDSRLAAAGSADGMIHVWDVVTQSLISIFRAHSSCVCGVQFLPNSTELVSGGLDGLAKRWEFGSRLNESGEERQEVKCLASFKGHQVSLTLQGAARNA